MKNLILALSLPAVLALPSACSTAQNTQIRADLASVQQTATTLCPGIAITQGVLDIVLNAIDPVLAAGQTAITKVTAAACAAATPPKT